MHLEPHGAAEPPSSMGALRGVERRTCIQHRIMNGERNPFTGPRSKRLWEQAHSVPKSECVRFVHMLPGTAQNLHWRVGIRVPMSCTAI
jgi:hypothetical protein